MELENYFEFYGDNAIRIAGTRVNIETVLNDYLQGASPEEILLRYPTLTLERIHATILYYLSNREKVSSYVGRVARLQYEEWRKETANPSDFVRQLRKNVLKKRRELNWPGSVSRAAGIK